MASVEIKKETQVEIEVTVHCAMCGETMDDDSMVDVDKWGGIVVKPEICSSCEEQIEEEKQEAVTELEGRMDELEKENQRLRETLAAVEIGQRFVEKVRNGE